MQKKEITATEKRDIIGLVQNIIDSPLEDYESIRKDNAVRASLIIFCMNMFNHDLYQKFINKIKPISDRKTKEKQELKLEHFRIMIKNSRKSDKTFQIVKKIRLLDDGKTLDNEVYIGIPYRIRGQDKYGFDEGNIYSEKTDPKIYNWILENMAIFDEEIG